MEREVSYGKKKKIVWWNKELRDAVKDKNKKCRRWIKKITRKTDKNMYYRETLQIK